MVDASVLTQREIDSLLTSGPSDEAADLTHPVFESKVSGLGKTVKRYDFRRPDKFSKEQLRTLQVMHETFARLAASSLSNQLRTNVEIKVSSIDQGLYEEYVDQLTSASFINVLRMAPLEGSIIVEFGQDLGFVVVDRLLGGAGALLTRSHEVTDIELQLLRGVGGTLAESVGEAWENLSAVQPTVTDVHQDIQMAALAPPTEVVIMVFMEVSVLDTVAGLSVCTPFSVLEPVLARLNAQVWVGTGGRVKKSSESQEHLRWQLERTPTSIRVELGSTDVSTADLARLQIGDVIRLDGVSSRVIPVRLGHVRKWYGRPGLSAGRVVVQLDDWSPEELMLTPPSDAPEANSPAELTDAPDAMVTPMLDESENSRAA